MLLLFIALFFAGLALREVGAALRCVDGFSQLSKIYLSICLILAILAAWVPLKKLRFEYYLSNKATQIAGVPASVHCNSAFDSIFDNKVGRAGHANPLTGDIVLQLGWCEKLMKYLDSPTQATRTERYSLMLFTHEVMHRKGELNEQKTECQAIQRNHIVGEILGIPKYLAQQHTQQYIKQDFPMHPYYSDKCGPGKAYDEELLDPIWE